MAKQRKSFLTLSYISKPVPVYISSLKHSIFCAFFSFWFIDCKNVTCLEILEEKLCNFKVYYHSR